MFFKIEDSETLTMTNTEWDDHLKMPVSFIQNFIKKRKVF